MQPTSEAASCGPSCRAPSGPSMRATEWAAHPRFATQTLLLRSHAGFRATSAGLVARAERIEDGDPPAFESVAWTFEGWMSAMRGHEHYEESKLYPYLAWRYGTTMECLVRQHVALHRARDDVRSALRDAAAGGGAARAVARALGEHRRVLLAHLGEEESVVIPMLLELAPEEFARYYNHPIGELLPR